MSKKKTRRSTPQGGAHKLNIGGALAKVGYTLAGLAIGTAVSNAIGKKDNVSGVDLLGLDGETSAYVTPTIVAAVGMAAVHLGKSEMLKGLGVGIMAAGCGRIINAAAGKSVVSLNGADDEAKNEMVFIPGLGDVEPAGPNTLIADDNQWQTTYNEPQLQMSQTDIVTQPVGGILL